MKKVLVLSIAVVLILFMGSSLASPRASKTIELTINSTQALVNGEKITLDQAPIILNQRTLVPLRFIGEEMGAEIEWDNAKQKITMTMDYAPYFKDQMNHLQASEEIPLGNTSGNLTNHAEFALYNDWIYTISPYPKRSSWHPEERDYNLTRIRSDGSDRTKLGFLFSGDSTNSFHFGLFNIVDDYLYFVSGKSRGGVGEFGNYEPVQLCKTDLMGNGFEVLFEGFFHTMLVYGDWIYLTASEPQESREDPWIYRYLYRMKTDGSDLELILPHPTFYPMIYQGYLYATCFFETEKGLYRMLPDGSNRTKISHRTGARNQGYLGWIYYIEPLDSRDFFYGPVGYGYGNIYRVRVDGKEEILVYEGEVTSLNLSNSWLYFANLDGIYRQHTKSNKLTKINQWPGFNILLFHDWIYFDELIENDNDEEVGGRFLMRTDGSKKIRMDSVLPSIR